MNTFGNNGELPVDPVDPIDWSLGDELVELYFQGSLWQEEHAQWLQDFLCNNSAGELVGGSTSAPKKIEIKVGLWERMAARKSRYTSHVNPTDKVSGLRTLLVNKKAKLPERYLFSYRMTVLNEDKSFLDQGMVGVEVPKLELLDNVTNFSRH